MAPDPRRSLSPMSSRARAREATRRSLVTNGGDLRRSGEVKSLRRFEPLTPANSPCDFGRRSVEKEDSTGESFRGEEKENEEKQITNASRLHSPGKDGKNFMSPTISAASKFTPSPRKKPLVERNDPVRSSMLLLDGKAIFFSSMHQDLEQKSDSGSHQNVNMESNNDVSGEVKKTACACETLPFTSKPSKRVTFSDVTSDSHGAGSIVTDFNILEQRSSLQNKDSCSYASPAKSAIDDDPSLPPYDPKTNYLSPRPRFLHYKPNPRTGMLFREKGVVPDTLMQMEDHLTSSETYLDSESTESSQEDESPEEESPEVAQCEVGVEQMEDEVYNQVAETCGTYAETISKDPQQNAEAPTYKSVGELHVPGISDSLGLTPAPNNEASTETPKTNNVKKSRAIFRLMCFPMLLGLFLAYISVSTTYPSMVEIAQEEPRFPNIGLFYQQSRIAAAGAKNQFLWLVNSVAYHSSDFISYITKLAGEMGKRGKTVQLQYMNMSSPREGIWNHDFKISHDFNLEPHTGGNEEDIQAVDAFNVELYEEIYLDEISAEYDQQMMMNEIEGATLDPCEENYENEFGQLELGEVEDPALIPELQNVLETQVTSEDTASELSETRTATPGSGSPTNDVYKDGLVTTDSALIPELQIVSETQVASHDTGISEVMETTIATLDPESLTVSESGQTSHAFTGDSSSRDGITTQSKENPSYKLNAIGVVPSVLAVLTVVALMTYQHKRSSISLAKTDYPSTRVSFYRKKHSHSERARSENCVTATPCPSDMNSFLKTAVYNHEPEVLSSERRRAKQAFKRESLTTSSAIAEGSPSYGSFTTFERIPIKSANGEEEILTPVRRSSRIAKSARLD